MKKINYIIIGFLSIIMLSFTLNEKSGYKIGDSAADFKLKNVDGSMVSLKDFKGVKGFIVVFTCNTCPYSKMYEQRIIDLDNKYKKLGYPVVAINPNSPDRQPGDSFEKMVKLAKTKSYPFPYLVDETQEIAKTYGATNTPHVYVLNIENGDLIVKYIGAIDNNTQDGSKATTKYVENAVEALLNGIEIKEKQTKAIGCTIKWS